jgi:hypothetical protein
MTKAHDLEVSSLIAQRGITDVLHFTTNHGLVGAGYSNAVVSRDHLDQSKHLEYIALPNCTDRLKDAAWTDYISLSITVVNNYMLGRSKPWHEHREDFWWAVLRFDASILSHPGVQFVTTNNTYGDVLRRAPGAAGLDALFGPRIPWGYYGSVRTRRANHPDNLPTDLQAEVLYPGELSLEFLTGIYVPEAELIDAVYSLQGFFPGLQGIPVEHRPEVFTT